MQTFRVKQIGSGHASQIIVHEFHSSNVEVEILDHLRLGHHSKPVVMDSNDYFVTILDTNMIRIDFNCQNYAGLDAEIIIRKGENVSTRVELPILINNLDNPIEQLLEQLSVHHLQCEYDNWDKLKIKLEQLILSKS
jgi:hypothetical protein